MAEPRITIIVTEELKQAAKVKAAENKQTLTKIITDFLMKWIKK